MFNKHMSSSLIANRDYCGNIWHLLYKDTRCHRSSSNPKFVLQSKFGLCITTLALNIVLLYEGGANYRGQTDDPIAIDGMSGLV